MTLQALTFSCVSFQHSGDPLSPAGLCRRAPRPGFRRNKRSGKVSEARLDQDQRENANKRCLPPPLQELATQGPGPGLRDGPTSRHSRPPPGTRLSVGGERKASKRAPLLRPAALPSRSGRPSGSHETSGNQAPAPPRERELSMDSHPPPPTLPAALRAISSQEV